MITLEEFDLMLSEIADEIPAQFLGGLSGGIILREESKLHPEGAGDLYIMGEYHNRRDMGRCICIYYGSFMRTHGWLPPEALRGRLRATLLHELTHHLESLAGERGLEVKDRLQIEEYKRTHNTNL